MHRLLFALSLLIMTHAHAAFLQICPATGGEPAGAYARLTGANGEPQRLVVSPTRDPACRSMPLPVSLDEVVAVHPLSEEDAAAAGDRLTLQGPVQDGRFVIGEVTSGREAASSFAVAMPFGENLIERLDARPFGIEERVTVQTRGGSLQLHCRRGNKPAGVILSGRWTLAQANAELHVAAAGQGRFALSLADAALAKRESSLAIGEIDAGKEGAQRFALPRRGFDRSAWHHFVIACPAQEATLDLSALRMEAQPGGAQGKASWIWNARQWQHQPQASLDAAAANGIKTLFVSVPVADGAVVEKDALAAFIRNASARGIAIWSVDGDPHMVLPSQHAASVTRVHAYAAYNASVEEAARLRGMQFDAEHYLLPGYRLAAQAFDRHYVALTVALREAAGILPIEFVVPFWWADKASLLDGLAAAGAGLCVMDYRTEPDQIRRFATPFLDWGVEHDRPVRIALEAGPIDSEEQRRYQRADAGELWMQTFDGMPVLMLLKSPRSNPAGPAFNHSSSAIIDGSATTFHGNTRRLMELLPDLETRFSAWPSFRGVALHELH